MSANDFAIGELREPVTPKLRIVRVVSLRAGRSVGGCRRMVRSGRGDAPAYPKVAGASCSRRSGSRVPLMQAVRLRVVGSCGVAQPRLAGEVRPADAAAVVRTSERVGVLDPLPDGDVVGPALFQQLVGKCFMDGGATAQGGGLAADEPSFLRLAPCGHVDSKSHPSSPVNTIYRGSL